METRSKNRGRSTHGVHSIEVVPREVVPRRTRALVGVALTAALAGCSGGGGDSAPGPQIVVTPATGFQISGVEGGPFSPASTDYVVTNQSAQPIDFSAICPEDWIDLSTAGGQLPPGQSATVTLTVDQVEAAKLGEGIYPTALEIENLTSGSGNTLRGVSLEAFAKAGLDVTPENGLVASGLSGGPFGPDSQDYELTNSSSDPLDWTASPDQPWVLVSSAGGQLAPGEMTTVTVSVDQALASGLSLGAHSASVDFVNVTTGAGSTDRDVTLNISSTGGMTVTEISQFGVTWTFDQPYEVGQFANGDWWVVGPIAITGIDPPSVRFGERVVNGSMVNPSPTSGWTQGYDSAMYAQYATGSAFENATNVAWNVAPATPLLLQPGSSLVSTISLEAPSSRPQVDGAAVLTVLDLPAPPGSFRPPYAGSDKTIRFNESQLDYSVLADLDPVASTPSLAEVERWFERPWLDHVPDWIGRYTHPRENMPDFGREICDQVGIASLMLNLDFTDLEKRTLLVRLVQVGIDFFGIVEDGGENNWPAGGGHHSGRKWPILFAGLVLGDAEMADIGSRDVAFNEDDQTFYVEETSPGVYNYGEGGYTAAHAGMPEWGSQHWKQVNRGQTPTFDDVDWFADPYRLCCTANVWWGELLAAHIMGAKALWDHDALFDYQDRYRQECVSRGILDWRLAWSAFPFDMWKVYRDDY